VNNASDTARVGSFGGTLTSLSMDDSVFAATVDLRLTGGQIVVQGVFDSSASRIVHAITGGTGIYRGARGQFSFTEPASGILDMTLTLLPRTSARLTSPGRAAFEQHVAALQKIVLRSGATILPADRPAR
jgi:hypothetical protein